MRLRIVGVVVDAENERRVRPIRRSRNDDLLHRPAQVLLRIRAFRKQTRRFDNDIRADRSPVDLARILSLENLEALAVHGDRIVGAGHMMVQVTEDGVVLKQVREGLGIGDVVDGYELDILVIQRRAHDVASDAAKAVDAYLDGHSSSE